MYHYKLRIAHIIFLEKDYLLSKNLEKSIVFRQYFLEKIVFLKEKTWNLNT